MKQIVLKFKSEQQRISFNLLMNENQAEACEIKSREILVANAVVLNSLLAINTDIDYEVVERTVMPQKPHQRIFHAGTFVHMN